MNTRLIKALTILCLIILAVSFYGCDSGNDLVVAKVGKDKIYSQDLDDIFSRNSKNYATFEDEFNNRKDIVDSLVIQQLLIQEAYKKNIDEVEEVNRIVLANSENFLLDILYEVKVLDLVNITEDETKDFYSKLEYKVHASHILVQDQDTANMILDSLKNGANFENLAINYSVDPQAKTTRGDLGYFVWGQMDPTFQEQVFKLDPGQISEPFETRYGWHIVRMNDRAPNELRSTYDQMTDQLKSSLEALQRNKYFSEYRDELMEKYPVKIDTVTCQYVENKRQTLYPPSILKSLPNNDFDLSQLDRHEKELFFATWDGGQVTLGQYLGQIKGINPNMKPDLNDYEGLSQFIFRLNFESILRTEARRIGIENDDRYKTRIKKFKELTMADIMENDSIPVADPPDEGEIRQYYEENQNEFLIPPKAHIYEILFNDYATAKTYAGKISSLERFKKLATQFTERSAKRPGGGDMGWINAKSYPQYFKAAQENDIGDVVGPIELGRKYALIYIADKADEDIKDFLMVKQEINDKLDRLQKQNTFERWVEGKKADVDIEINENNIRASINKALYASPDSTQS